MKVAFQWVVDPEIRIYLQQQLPDLTLAFPASKEDAAVVKVQKDAEVIVGFKLKPELMATANQLRLFINPGAGVQHLVKAAEKLGDRLNFVVVNSHSNAYNTAQHTATLTLTLLNKIIPHHQWTKEGKWRTSDKDACSDLIRNKTIGLLGYGHIAKKVQAMLTPFECQFIGYKRHQDPKATIDIYQPDQLSQFLERTDVLIHLLPQTTETVDLIGASELKSLGSSAYVISMGRGPVIHEESLYKALKNGGLAGAAIDVWYAYSPEPDADGRKFPWHFPFGALENVLLSPHRAGKPFDDKRRWDDIIENIRIAQQGRTDFLNVVDLVAGY